MTVEDLKQYGLEEMHERDIETFLDNHSIGVLGLANDGVPYLLPLSYAYDGGTLYFTYLLGEQSEKERLTEQTARGRFLVYSAETMFSWRSVLLEGEFSKVPEHEWDELSETLSGVWRPELFDDAVRSRNVSIYAFDVVEQTGLRHTGLAPGMARR